MSINVDLPFIITKEKCPVTTLDDKIIKKILSIHNELTSHMLSIYTYLSFKDRECSISELAKDFSMISFNEEMAAEYGLSVIIFCTKIGDWLKWNKANEQNFYDGKYWTYNSLKALTLLFPFWSTDQLRKVIKRSEERRVGK